MARNKQLKKMFALLLAAILVFHSVNVIPAQAENSKTPEEYGYEKVTLKQDFDIADGTYTKASIGSVQKYAEYQGDTLNGKYLDVNLKLTGGGIFKFAGVGPDYGLQLWATSGRLYMADVGRPEYTPYIEPGEFGLTTFEDAAFQLWCSVEYVIADDDDSKNDVKIGMWINEKFAGFYTFKNCVGGNDGFANYMSFVTVSDNAAVSVISPITVSKYRTPEEYGYQKVTLLEDFGIADGIYKHGEVTNNVLIGQYTGDTLDGKYLDVNLKLTGMTTFKFAGGPTEDYGVAIWVSAGKLYVSDALDTENAYSINPADFEMETFENQEFRLWCSVEQFNADTDEAADDVKVGIWLNETFVTFYTFIDFNENNSLGKKTGVILVNEGWSATINSYIFQTPVNLGFRQAVLLEEFGVQDGVYKNGDIDNNVLTGQYSGGTLDGKYLDTMLELTGYATVKYGGGPSTDYGVALWVSAGMLYVSDALDTENAYSINPADFEMETFENQEFRLWCSVEQFNADTDEAADDVKVGIWINEVFVDFYVFNDFNNNNSLGVNLGVTLLQENSAINISSPLHGFLTVLPSDFEVEDTKCAYNNNDFAVQGNLRNEYVLSKAQSLNGKTLSADVCFDTTNSYLIYGGLNNAWGGIAFCRNANDRFQLVAQTAGMSLHSHSFEVTKAGLKSVTEPFNLKISVQFLDSDGDGAEDDVKYGIWFNNVLYNNTYVYALNDASYLGTYLGVYCAEGAQMSITSISRLMPQELTPYILEEFQVDTKTYNKEVLESDTGFLGRADHITLNDSAISGNVVFDGNADIILCGEKNNPWSGYRFVQNDNGQIVLKHSLGHFKTDLNPSGILATFDVKDGKSFKFTLTQEYVDADADGLRDDVRLSIWNEDEMYKNKYFYMLDYVSCISPTIVLYSNAKESEGSVTVLRTVPHELYNLAESAKGYCVLGQGNITVNGEKTENGATISVPGEYLIRCVGKGAYVKYISLYQSGDSHPDGTIDIRDLIAIKKVINGVEIRTKAGREGADANRDDIVEYLDYDGVRKHLLDVEAVAPKKNNYVAFEEDIMPIAGYYGPFRPSDSTGKVYDQLTDDMYDKITKAGINLICCTMRNYALEEHRQEIIDSLALASKYNVGMFVMQNALVSEKNENNRMEYLAEFAKYPAFKGIMISDEPNTTYYGTEEERENSQRLISDYAELSQSLNRYSNIFGYMNLLPLSSSLSGTGDMELDYKQYLQEYLDTCNPRALSWDLYVFGSSTHTQRYFRNLSIAKEKADSKGIPFWGFVQAGYINATGSDTPTQGQLLWNVNTMLAYGVKGIQYYPLVQPLSATENGTNFKKNGLIGADGTLTPWYERAQKANSQIALIDEILMNATSKAFLWTGYDAKEDLGDSTVTSDGYVLKSITTETYTHTNKTRERSAVVGVFEHQGKTVYYVVNYDMQESRTITLNFDGVQHYSVLSEQLVEEHTNTSGEDCQLKLEAGGAALITITEPCNVDL